MAALTSISAEPGLRDRKKSRKRDEIIAAAQILFADQGIDATTMAEIAAAAEVSIPTVFNYFGSKDGIIIAMITEGTKAARERDRAVHWQPGVTLAELLADFFLRISTRTLEIAGKRVWRYAEAAVIRHPEADFARHFAQVDAALVKFVADFLGSLHLTTRAGIACPFGDLAVLFTDTWLPCFIKLITSNDMTLQQHEAQLRDRITLLVNLIFTHDCAARPRLKEPTE